MTYIETECKFEHAGQTFESGGSVATDDFLIGYPKFETELFGSTGELMNWHGTASLGRAVIVRKWDTPQSWISSHSYQIEVKTPDGRIFTGRCAGNGMIAKLKPKKGKSAWFSVSR